MQIFFRTFITSHRVGPLAVKHQVLRIQVNKSKSWCYWVSNKLTTKTGHWAASVFAIRLLTKTLSASGAGLLSSSRPPGKLWYIGCFCCCALFLAKSNRRAAETEKQNLEGQKMLARNPEQLQSTKLVAGSRRLLFGEGEDASWAMEKGEWCEKRWIHLLVIERKVRIWLACLFLAPWW